MRLAKLCTEFESMVGYVYVLKCGVEPAEFLTDRFARSIF